MNEKLKLWFFRDLTDDQRLKLFGLFGLPVDEIGKVHSRQAIALRHITRKLVELVRNETSPPRLNVETTFKATEEGHLELNETPPPETKMRGSK